MRNKSKIDYSKFSTEQLIKIVQEKEKVQPDYLNLLKDELDKRNETKLSKEVEDFLNGDFDNSNNLEAKEESLGLFTSSAFQDYSEGLDQKIIIKNKVGEYIQSGLSNKSIVHNLKANFGLNDEEVSKYFEEINREIKFGNTMLNAKFYLGIASVIIALIVYFMSR